MLKFWGWVKRYWKVIGVFAVSVMGWLFFRTGPNKPIKNAKLELAVSKAHARARQMELEVGKRVALDTVQSRYRTALANLNELQAQQAKELRDDPAELAAFLVRAGS